jgi:hypothetical protein
LRQFLPATISRVTAATMSIRNAPSRMAAAIQPMLPDSVTATRPASQAATSPARGAP